MSNVPLANLSEEPDFQLGGLRISPSSCRVSAGDKQMRVEAQTMAALVLLARAQGATVSRRTLVEACWEGRIVSEDAISRTILKVRKIAKALEPAPFVLETVPKVGYRLLAADGKSDPAPTSPIKAPPGNPPNWRRYARPAAASGALVLAAGVGFFAATFFQSPGAGTVAALPGVHASAVIDALHTLNVDRMRHYLAKGWNPNWSLDAEGNRPLHRLMEVCERSAGHDRTALVSMAKELISAGEDPAAENGWRDNPLDIAVAKRYCGPDHPVVAHLKEKGVTLSPDDAPPLPAVDAPGGIQSRD